MVETGIDSVGHVSAQSAVVYGWGSVNDRPVPLDRGICWSESSTPTLQDFVCLSDTDPLETSFSGYAYGLKPNTTYHIRAFSIFDDEVTYSKPVSITTEPANKFTDYRDGQIYFSLPIGNHEWTIANVRYKTENSFFYRDNPEMENPYGMLYTWEAAREACPVGWHLPSDDEWKDLEKAAGLSQGKVDLVWEPKADVAHKLMMPGGRDFWQIGTFATNEVGFGAYPGGSYDASNNQFERGPETRLSISHAAFWSSTSKSDSTAYSRIVRGDNVLHSIWEDKNNGLSVRCIKD